MYAGRPATITLSDVEPGNVDRTVVQGFVVGDGGCGQPMIGAPTRSGSHRMKPPPRTCAIACFGINVTWPPWAHVICALLVTTGGRGATPFPDARKDLVSLVACLWAPCSSSRQER